MEAKYLAVVLIGLGMTYLGFFGISGLGLILTPPSSGRYIVQYDMNDLSWAFSASSSGVVISPSGQLYLDHTLLGMTEVWVRDSTPQITPNLPSTWEIKVSIDSTVDVSFRFLVNEGGKLCAMVLHHNSIEVYSDTSGNTKFFAFSHVTGQFYTYRVVMDSVNYRVFRDDVEVGSGVLVPNQWLAYYVYIGLKMVNGYEAKGHVDYFYAVTGAVLPTYRVSVDGYCNTESKAVTAQVQADGADPKSTPCYYDFPLGTTHTLAVISSNDAHPLLGWDSLSDHGIFLYVSSAGSHVAHYEQAAPTTYTVDFSAYCDSEATAVSVTVTSEGISKQTSCSFTYSIGTSHTVSAASQDGSGHPFLGWDSSTSGNTILQVSSEAPHTAHYRANDNPTPSSSVHIPVTVKIYDGSAWKVAPNYPLTHYWQNNNGEWILLESASTGSNGVYDYQGSYLGKHRFTAQYQGQTYSAETPVCSDGEYWPLLLQLGSGPVPPQYDWQTIMLYSGLGVTGIGSILFVYPKRRD